MKKERPHLSPDLIESFVNGPTLLRRSEFRHLQDCDQCSRIWWDLKLEGKPQTRDEAKEEPAAA
jgi:hypothetical protein